MKPKWTVKKLENGQIVQVYDELSDFKYFTIPWSHLAATMKDQPCWIFWYSPATDIHNEVSQVWSFPVWYYVVDDDDKSQMLKWMLWRGGKHVHGRLVFIIGVGLVPTRGLFLIEREWSKEDHRGCWEVGPVQFSLLPSLDFLTRITFNAGLSSPFLAPCDSVPGEVGGLP